ncbi:MAG: hypothetical protein ABI665_15070 [Vicinamibacterales bacterium]
MEVSKSVPVVLLIKAGTETRREVDEAAAAGTVAVMASRGDPMVIT